MASIDLSQLPGIFNRGVTETYTDRLMPELLFSSMAGETTDMTKLVSVEVQRNHETIAVDVNRISNGVRNQFSRSSVKLFQPPYYDEYFDLTELEIYDRIFSKGEVTDRTVGELVDTASDKLALLEYKVKRAKEKQWTEVMKTGIVQLNSGDNIDYKRKAASIKVLEADQRWNQTTADIIANFVSAGDFLRSVGKVQSTMFMAIMGEGALSSFLSNPAILALGDQTYIKRLTIDMAGAKMNGAVPHGTLSAGSYSIDIYTYPEFYDTVTDAGVVTRVPYWDANMVVVLPKSGSQFTTKFAAVPARFIGSGTLPEYVGYVDEKYHLYNYVSERGTSHNFHLRSAPLAVPVSVDQIYTMQVLA